MENKNLIKISEGKILHLLNKSEKIAMDNVSKCLSMEKIEELNKIRLLRNKVLNCGFNNLSANDFEKIKKIEHKYYDPINIHLNKKIVSDEKSFKQKLYSNVIDRVNNTFSKLNEKDVEEFKELDEDEILKIIILNELLKDDIRENIQNWGKNKYPNKEFSFVEKKVVDEVFTEDVYNEIKVFIDDNIVSVIDQIESLEVTEETFIEDLSRSETVVNERRRVRKKL